MQNESKLVSLQEACRRCAQAQEEGGRAVLTNGCFDLLHAGHVCLLQEARIRGDLLVVALNSDRSVRELKGPGRPVVSERGRALVLAALECVDVIVTFDTLRVTPVIEALRPSVYVKGGDYTLETLDPGERLALESVGAEIVLVPAVEGCSTTGMIEKASQVAAGVAIKWPVP